MTGLHKSKIFASLFASLFTLWVFLILGVAPLALADQGGAFAKDALPQPSEEFYVNDQASLLTEATKTEILNKNASLNQSYGVQLVVYTVQTLPGSDFAGRVEYLRSLISAWQVGGAGGRGLLVALSVSDGDYLAVAGDGLKALFTTETLKGLLQNHLEADFSTQAYDAGVLKFFNAAAAQAESYCAAHPELFAQQSPSSQVQRPASSKKSPGSPALLWVGIAAGVVAVASIAVFIFSGHIGSRRRGRAVHRHRPLITPARTNVLRHETRPMVQIKSYRQSTGVYRNQKPSRTSRNDRRQ